jgi:hypothetical protein
VRALASGPTPSIACWATSTIARKRRRGPRAASSPHALDAESAARRVNETEALTRDATVHQLFEERLRRRGDGHHVRGDHVTYDELNWRANRLARRLRQMGVGPRRPRRSASINDRAGHGHAGHPESRGAYVPRSRVPGGAAAHAGGRGRGRARQHPHCPPGSCQREPRRWSRWTTWKGGRGRAG